MDKKVQSKKMSIKEDVVNSNISSIGMSENLIAVKRVCRQIESRCIHFDVQDSFLEKLLLQGMKEVKSLISENEKFPITSLLKSKGTKKFFDELVRGKKDIEGISKLSDSEQTKRENFESKIKKLKNKGDFEEASKWEYQLASFNNPDEYIKFYSSEITKIEKQGITENNLKDYEDAVEEFKRLTRIRERRYKNSESFDFVKLLDYDLREFIGELLFKKDGSNSQSEERFLRTYYGDMVIDFEHILLLYLHMEKTGHPHLNTIKGILYYKALETFYSEVKQIKDSKTYNALIKPSFDVGADTFAWKRFPQYMRKYMLYFMQPKDYDCYYIEIPNLAQLGFLMSREIDGKLDYSTMIEKFSKAKSIISKRKYGIFFKFLTKEQENALLPYILTENFPMWHMDGSFKDDLVEGFITRQQKWYNDVDMYNRTIKPYSLDMIGSIIYNKLSNLENLVDKDLAYIYYVSPQRIGIAIKNGLEDYYIDEIFGEAKAMLKKVTKPKLEEIVFGELL